ncbi:MAG TPA: DNA mismatch repair endonuclease MutL [Anaerolineae bacterium]|nr:DNA mismatch repair endonuclease MutL [Anaerolineae bacterium]HIQ04737.1 DNA mismatch repair endonuclease MutL [Anaerolineae bacterium]
MPIHVLPPEVVGKIAAGEVVERPASAVKELIENSIDAGATEIRVEVQEGGRRRLRVVDNGCGIAADEVELAFAHHATSKLRTAEDLEHVTTLGFRGEALASIAAVSRLTMLTRSADESAGTLIRLEGGQIVAREKRGSPPGTIVTVEQLFYNVPARRKFLRRPATEAGHISRMVTRYAMAYPERRFSLVSDSRLTFQSTGSGDLYDVLVKVLGLEMAKQLLPVPGEQREQRTIEEAIRVYGYVGVPSLHRSNRSHITLFVNGRWIQDNSLTYAITEAYHTFLPVGRYPVAVVFIKLDPAAVDVNVHPTKAEVRFQDARAVFRAVQQAVRRVLVDHAPVPMATPASTGWTQPDGWADRRQTLVGAGREEPLQVPLDWQPQPEQAGSAMPGTPGQPTALPQIQALRPPARLPLLRVVGQVGTTYIVAEGPGGMYLIDQHAAHERVLYDRLMAELSRQAVAQQALLEPFTLDVDSNHAGLVAEYLDSLLALGFDIESFGPNTFLVRAVPAVLDKSDPRQALEEIVEELEADRSLVAEEREARLVRMICKRAAVKAGQVLSTAEMQELVRQLEASSSPRTCPHGRPTMIHISAEQLEKQFGRT